jgi:hypothetical protein
MIKLNRFVKLSVITVISIGSCASEGYSMPPKSLSVPLNLNKVADDIVKKYEERQSRIKDMLAAKSPATYEPIDKPNLKMQKGLPTTPKSYTYVLAKY